MNVTGARIGGIVVDSVFVVVAVVVLITSGIFPVPTIGFMGDYSRSEHKTYWELFAFGWGFLFAVSACSHGFLSASLGQWLFELKITQKDGAPAQLVRRLLVGFLRHVPALFILTGGPILGLLGGPETNKIAASLLLIGLLGWPFWALFSISNVLTGTCYGKRELDA